MESPASRATLFAMPPEILLHILSYLDLPELSMIGRVIPCLSELTEDPVLHQQRLRVVCPSRVNHELFGRSPSGQALRPTVGELVQRGVMQGLGLERRWRMGGYIYSLNSIIQYENGRALFRRHAAHVVSVQMRRRSEVKAGPGSSQSANRGSFSASSSADYSTPVNGSTGSNTVTGSGSQVPSTGKLPTLPSPGSVSTSTATSSSSSLSGARGRSKTTGRSRLSELLQALYSTRVLPNETCSQVHVARSLIPVMRRLKWCMQRDRLAKLLKEDGGVHSSVGASRVPGSAGQAAGGFAAWLQSERGMRVVPQEGEKVRLAVCPGIRKKVGFYEELCRV